MLNNEYHLRQANSAMQKLHRFRLLIDLRMRLESIITNKYEYLLLKFNLSKKLTPFSSAFNTFVESLCIKCDIDITASPKTYPNLFVNFNNIFEFVVNNFS